MAIELNWKAIWITASYLEHDYELSLFLIGRRRVYVGFRSLSELSRLPEYCNVLQAEVMPIYPAAQKILI